MKRIWNALKRFFGDRRVKFTLVSVCYLLIFVVWTGNWWLLLGEIVIYDIYYSKYLYRLFWRKHKERKRRSRTYRKTAEWIEAIVFAVVVATLIRIFFFEMYVIPTSSMEGSLRVGDYLCVSKVAYGPKMPNTPISFPFVHNTLPFSQTRKSYIEWPRWPYKRLCGLGQVERGDAVVFNFPAGDTVLLENTQITYYDVLRDYARRYGPQRGREMLRQQFTVASRPVDKRENYIKRCIALPGDTLRIVDGRAFVNGEPEKEYPGRQYLYFVTTDGTPISHNAFERMEIARSEISYDPATRTYGLFLTEENLDHVRGMKNVVEIVPYRYDTTVAVFPHVDSLGWTGDDYGPLWIPRRGATVSLTTANLPLYRRIIEVYEGNDLQVDDDGTIYINGDPADSYTFNMDYYFMMGDNRHNSADSRFWGFVPEDHIVGKASFVWLSLDREKSFPSNIRWRRMFRGIE